MILNFINNISDSEESSLNEDILTEKCWVKIIPDGSNLKSGSSEDSKVDSQDDVFYFYTTDSNINADVSHLINRLYNLKAGYNQDNNQQYGTYKQKLNQDAVQALKNKLDATKGNYRIESAKESNMLSAKDSHILTITDRSLRRNAKKEVMKGSASILKPDAKKQVLVHHIDGKEYNNATNNLIVVEYTKNDPSSLNLAKSVHAVLHTLGSTSSEVAANISSFKIDPITIRLLDPDDATKVKTLRINISITS